MLSGGGMPRRWPWRRPMLLMVSMAASLHPPSVSATMGTKWTPTDLQASAWAAIFLSSPTCKAYPGVEAAPACVRCCIVEMTVTSRAGATILRVTSHVIAERSEANNRDLWRTKGYRTGQVYDTASPRRLTTAPRLVEC